MQLPLVGLGTFKSKGTDVKNAVKYALQHGIRHIDTASVYRNEEDIGIAVRELIKEGVVKRDDIYITSKVSPSEQGTEAATAACEAILNRLNCGYVDLMLIHWPGVAKTEPTSPQNGVKRLETWKVLEDFQKRGLFREIGVSNYEIRHLEELLPHVEVPPAYNQVECHPLFPQEALRKWCADHNIGVIAYSSYATGILLIDEKLGPQVAKIASSCAKTPAQLLLCWGLQKSCSGVLPKSIKTERILEFCPEAPGMQKDPSTGRWLPEEAENALDNLDASEEERKKYCWDPSGIA